MPRLNFLVRVAVCFFFIFLPLHTLDQWFYDHFFQLRGTRKQATPFMLVRVNHAKLFDNYAKKNGLVGWEHRESESRPQSIWYSDFYQTLIDRIQLDSPQQIVFPTFYQRTAGGQTTSRGETVLFSSILNEENKLIPPLATLTTNDNYGFSNIFPDNDNVVRKTYLVYSSGPSLALRTYHRLNPGEIKRNLLDPLWIDFRGPAGSYPTFGAQEVLEESLGNHRFQGKIVLIGPETSSTGEYETPFGKMPRLEVQANIIDSFLTHRDIVILPHWITLTVAAAAVVTSIVIILTLPLTLAWLFLLLFSLVILLASLLVFSQFKVWAGVANPIFCIFGTHLLMLGYKLNRQEEQQWKVQQESDYLKELDQFKNNFISLFSHDLKTPIAKIKAITDRLLSERKDLDPETRESLKSIDRTSNELARSISDILKVTKMESMPIEPIREVIDLNRLVEVAVQRLKFLADEKAISLIQDLEPLFSMEGDQHLIQEVITNLLENAIKYSHKGTQVTLRTREEAAFVRVSVIDEGPGIPSDEIPRVTGKFYRGKKVSEAVKGSGLGLYLAKYFVEMHQGKLEIRSELGKGTEVSFLLPITT